ncbi:hypothetical protein SmJEL517_g05762 [Synchytrium microbalum]|uniref:ABC transporter domain-containing protein n=1 Tax=Synchytrium microbalum TaxID=1806994 RepID=A0A507BYF1_9FUNG|nr:uncharacterized protein SmJEL517_g05762 [Synchytrium microbalum]TPX30746.1 hypothetical protein SmJEL517_g05762 [Synchytrium microbalum]
MKDGDNRPQDKSDGPRTSDAPVPATAPTTIAKIENDVESSILGAVTRSLALQAGNLARLFSTTGIFVIKWWFRSPAKLFRPFAVNPWTIFKHLAEHEGTRLTPKFVHGVIQKEGFPLNWRNFVPVLVVNSIVGMVLFNVYSLTLEKLSKHINHASFIAGAAGGFAQAVISTPLENIMNLVGRHKIVEGRKEGILGTLRKELVIQVEQDHFKRGKIVTLYKDFTFTAIRDASSFALFFGVFETFKDIGKQYVKESASVYGISEQHVGWLNGACVVSAGALGGIFHQMVVFPLERWKSLVQDDTSSRWSTWIHVARKQRVGGLWKGVGPQLLRATPPSALALFVYELALCPLMMIVIAAGLGVLITGLIQKGTTYYDVLYCASNGTQNSFYQPLYNVSLLNTVPGTGYVGLTEGNVVALAAYLSWVYLGASTNNGPPGATALAFRKECVFWFGDEYPYDTSIYERNPNVSLRVQVRDTMYASEPRSGWAQAAVTASQSTVSTEQSVVTTFTQQQTRPWALVSASDSAQALLGSKPLSPILNVTQLGIIGNSPAYKYANQSNGLLDTIATRYYADVDSSLNFNGFQPVPYFNISTNSSKTSNDAALAAALNQVIQDIAGVDKRILTTSNPNPIELAQFYANIGKLLQSMPYGAIYIDKLDAVAKQYGYTLQFGTDLRIAASSNFPEQGLRQLIMMTELDNAILRNSNSSFGSAQITQGLRAFPQIKSNRLAFAFSGLIGRIIFPFGVSFLLPIYVITLVQEKENRILIMMRMAGLKQLTYYAAHFIHFFVLFLINAFIFFLAGNLAKLDMFTKTSRALLIILFLEWGLLQISLAFLFASVFNRSRIALVITFLIVLCGVVISLVTDSLFTTSQAPSAYFIWGPFAFMRALSILNEASYTQGFRPYTLDMVRPGNEVFNAMIFMAAEIPIYFFLAYYLQNILPNEFGIRKPWHFIFTDPFASAASRSRARKHGGIDPKSEEYMATAIAIDENELQFEDADVKAERVRVESGAYTADTPLVMKGMRKLYSPRAGGTARLAVKDVSLAVESGIVFGLLGPNGAGKTTLINILTGVYEASAGVATIAGYDIKTQSDQVYRHLGVCPQFDIHWDALTIEEHLLFYARLKGVPTRDERAVVIEAEKQVALFELRHRRASTLSGGEKRRLSIAIALIGDPKVVFLDEPTTGLDPEVRRLVWDVINEARVGKTIVLTTHSMEEASVLAQRIGIMAKGTLRVLGNQQHLKTLYGSGFRVYFIAPEERVDEASAYVESLLPAGWHKVDAFSTNVSYEFPSTNGVIATLFSEMEANKERVGISDWGCSQTTLDEVFLKIISEGDADGGA